MLTDEPVYAGAAVAAVAADTADAAAAALIALQPQYEVLDFLSTWTRRRGSAFPGRAER